MAESSPNEDKNMGKRENAGIQYFLSVSAGMRPCGIPANKLGFPHISKHGK